jgi:hypothetical protein
MTREKDSDRKRTKSSRNSDALTERDKPNLNIEKAGEGINFLVNLEREESSDFFDAIDDLPPETPIFKLEPVRWPLFAAVLFFMACGLAAGYGLFHLQYYTFLWPKGPTLYGVAGAPVVLAFLYSCYFYLKYALKEFVISKKSITYNVIIPFISKQSDSCDMVKVQDVRYSSIFGVATVKIKSRDKTMPEFDIPLVTLKQAELLNNFIVMYSPENITELAAGRRKS